MTELHYCCQSLLTVFTQFDHFLTVCGTYLAFTLTEEADAVQPHTGDVSFESVPLSSL